MKRNIFFSGLGDKFALVTLALTGVLFTSCEKEDFDATFDANPAKAVIAVSAYYAADGRELSDFTISTSAPGSVVNGKEIVITGNKDISEQTVEVSITCNKLTGAGTVNGTGKVKVPNLKAGSVGHYSITFFVYEDRIVENVPSEPAEEPAEAKVIATAVNANDEEIEGVTFEFKSTVEGGMADGGIYTISGKEENDGKILKQTVTVIAHVGEQTDSAKVDIPELKVNTKATYYVKFCMIDNEIEEITTYSVETGEPESNEMKYYLTGDKEYSHNGIEQWLSNYSEYKLHATVTYKTYTGLEVIKKEVKEESDFVNSLIEGFESVGGIKEVDAAMQFDVSAWSIYAAWATVTTTEVPYTVIKKVTKDGVVNENEVATFSLKTKSVVAGHEEVAHPDHSHGYVVGHGHDHGNSGNAGGGIVYAD